MPVPDLPEPIYRGPSTLRLQRMEHARGDLTVDQRVAFNQYLIGALTALIGDDAYDLALRTARANVFGRSAVK